MHSLPESLHSTPQGDQDVDGHDAEPWPALADNAQHDSGSTVFLQAGTLGSTRFSTQ